MPADRLEEAEVVTSLTGEQTKSFWGGTEEKHRPILDIDLYIDKELPWREYKRLLEVLADCGIIERGYLAVSVARKHTAVRLPWVKKSAA